MAAVLTPAEYEYASGLEVHEIPNRLRCANCNRPVFEAMKTDCCDTSICKSCSENLSKACPACSHPITSEMTREDKRTRVTLKAHIKGELQKRNNAQAAAEAAQEKLKTPDAVVPDAVEELVNAPSTIEPAVDLAAETSPPAQDQDVEEQRGGDVHDGDDHSSVEIITERPEDDLREAQGSIEQQDAGIDNEDESHQENHELAQGNGQMNGFDMSQDGFNNTAMNFGGMNGFNPMMAMQAGMGMPPFGLLPGMMGMPTMGMDPSMMFNGGFPGMNGMANMMNGNIMGGNFGMGDMNDFTSYNPQYGNRYDDRSHGQSFFPSNRGYGRGGYGQNYRGRGQGFYNNRGGRGRGGWNNQYQDYNNSNNSHNSNFRQPNNFQGRDRFSQQNNQSFEASAATAGDASAEQEVSNGQDSTHNEPEAEAVLHEQQPESQPVPSGEYVEDEVDYGDDVPVSVQETSYNEQEADNNRQTLEREQRQSARLPSPPVNAPTGPKAMRDGLPNSGRYSRPPVSQNARETSNASGAAAAAAAAAAAESGGRPTTSSSHREREKDQRYRDQDSHEQEERGSRHRRSGRSRSRSPPRHDQKYKKHSSRSGDMSERYARDQSVEDDDYNKRKDRKRMREHEDEKSHREKKRSRSVTPDDSSSRRHRSRRGDKDRSYRDRSRDKRKSSHRDREQESGDEEDYQRHKSKSHKSSRRERNGHDSSEQRGDSTSRHSRPAVLEQHSDDIGFRIKGSKSRESKSSRGTGAALPKGPASHRDPYAEERERMKEQRLQRDAQRRQSTQSSGKRGREEEGDGEEYHSKKKRSRPRAKYEGEIENHEHERESRRWG